ncbi:uncharacterized protein LOC121799523 [Salvia splendens]|uniref:uncharacterized protein LOC121799523 n=1 Tax=Salvia splendens TaxID=180675 RepID=UPI001C256DF2|nr:uncharacterized protein LOC121799523 [Salvia splendens]
MVKKDKQIVSQKSTDFDAISCNELRKLLQKEGVDKSNMGLMELYSEPSRARPNEELRLNDDVDEHNDDPDYMLMFKKLKKHGNAYRIEYMEEDGSRAIIKYEEASSSDTECDQEQIDGPLNQMPLAEVQGTLDSHLAPSREEVENLTSRDTRSKSNKERKENAKLLSHSTYVHAPHTPSVKRDLGLDKNCGQRQYRRKLRSYDTKLIDEHVNRAKEMKNLTRTDPRVKSKSGKEENVVVMEPVSRTYPRKRKRNKCKSEYDEEKIQFEPDYHLWYEKLKPVDDHLMYTARGIEVLYEMKSGACDRMKEDEDDDHYDDESSDVEIIDSDTFCKMNNRDRSAFRDKVIAALRKPFNLDEYNRLRRDIKFRPLKGRHMDLRNGRERQMGTKGDGKCYLHYHPDLKKKLSQAKGDRPKRLNLLRGFFIWIKQPEEFSPWHDKECLAVRPGSG